MLRSVKKLQGYRVEARDGRIGSINEFYFDDERWTVRYLVVDTGKWLPGRLVLISPIAVRHTDWTNSTLSLNLTRDQVKNSPPIDTHKPVARREEAEFLRYYGYPYYWVGPGLWGATPFPTMRSPQELAELDAHLQAERDRAHAQGDEHLRQTKEVLGYHIQASDGEIGHVDDLLVEDDTWAIRYLMVDTSNWWVGNKVLMAPDWAEDVNWVERRVVVNLTREAIRRSPRFDVATHIDRQWEADYYAHFKQSPYWHPAGTSGSNQETRGASTSAPPRLVSLNKHNELAVSREDHDPRGWPVMTDIDQCRVGKVHDVIVDTATMKGRYLDVELDASLTAFKSRHVLLPVSCVRVEEDAAQVAVDRLDVRSVQRLPSFAGLPVPQNYGELFNRETHDANATERQPRPRDVAADHSSRRNRRSV